MVVVCVCVKEHEYVCFRGLHVAIKMALRDVGKLMKIPLNVNLTCLNSKVRGGGRFGLQVLGVMWASYQYA